MCVSLTLALHLLASFGELSCGRKKLQQLIGKSNLRGMSQFTDEFKHWKRFGGLIRIKGDSKCFWSGRL